MEIVTVIGVGFGSFIAGVMFSEKVKTWLRVKSKDALDTTVRVIKEQTHVDGGQ